MNKVRFQFDEHVSHAVARGLRREGVDVLTAGEAGLLNTPDVVILAHAGIACCAQRARSIGELIAALLLIYEVMEADEIAGRVEYLLSIVRPKPSCEGVHAWFNL